MKQTAAVLLVLGLAVLACGPAGQTQVADEPVDQDTPEPQIVEVTVLVTEIVEIPVEVPVTVTPSETPPGPTLSPEELDATATATALGPLVEPKGDGFFVVGVDIAPGLWRSTGDGDDCYWKRSDDSQNILDNHFGASGGSVRIQPTDYEIEFNGCGTWEYQGP